eukprot:6082929-Amphidinium_carterae.1
MVQFPDSGGGENRRTLGNTFALQVSLEVRLVTRSSRLVRWEWFMRVPTLTNPADGPSCLKVASAASRWQAVIHWPSIPSTLVQGKWEKGVGSTSPELISDRVPAMHAVLDSTSAPTVTHKLQLQFLWHLVGRSTMWRFVSDGGMCFWTAPRRKLTAPRSNVRTVPT